MQAEPYSRIAEIYIEAVELDLPPVKTIAEFTGVDYEILARRLESMRGKGWLPAGQPENSPAWLQLARSMLADRLSEQAAVEVAREAKRVAVERRKRSVRRARHKHRMAHEAYRAGVDGRRAAREARKAMQAEHQQLLQADRKSRQIKTTQTPALPHPIALDTFLGAPGQA